MDGTEHGHGGAAQNRMYDQGNRHRQAEVRTVIHDQGPKLARLLKHQGRSSTLDNLVNW
jgi:hypothetical protein